MSADPASAAALRCPSYCCCQAALSTLTLSAAASLPHKALTGADTDCPAATTPAPNPRPHTGCSLPTLWQLLEARLPLDSVSVLLPVLKQHLWQQLRTDPSLILTTEELQAAAK